MERTYRIRFYKRLLSSNGHQFEPLQAVVEVRALDQIEAVELARKEFAVIEGVQHWSLRADYEQVECGPIVDRAGSISHPDLAEISKSPMQVPR